MRQWSTLQGLASYVSDSIYLSATAPMYCFAIWVVACTVHSVHRVSKLFPWKAFVTQLTVHI